MSYGVFGGQRQGGLKVWPLLVGLLVIAVTAFHGCQQGPFGRTQLVALNPKEEATLGAQAFQEVLKTSDVVPGGPAVDAVRRLAGQLASAAEQSDVLQKLQLQRQDFQWEVRL